MYINYKLGTKLHFNKDIKSFAYVGIKRDRIDYKYYKFSIIENSNFELKFDFDIETWHMLKLLGLIGKKFPLKSTRAVAELNFGIVWELEDPYRESLADPGTEDTVTFIIRPLIRF